ncbi:hypothetical protein FB45DRAFT_1066144 [Roridomyces roridus]|uniref:Uncharacterized protein n=1 Tax=Roridomyces roridus TaxID=1738132 RepID=A0AAD7F9T1_9AGAR|nr:hypothetical protein FB45DRAFT_1066144 [Roridomyces roridus]
MPLPSNWRATAGHTSTDEVQVVARFERGDKPGHPTHAPPSNLAGRGWPSVDADRGAVEDFLGVGSQPSCTLVVGPQA